MSSVIEHSAAHILSQYFIDQALAEDSASSNPAPDWSVYVDELLDEPDNVVVIYNTAGTLDGRDMETGVTYEHLGIQVLVRATNNPDGYKKVAALSVALDAINRVVVALDTKSYTIECITKTSPIIPLGTGRNPERPQEEDRKGRKVFTVNAICTIWEN